MGMDLSYQAIPDDSPALERARHDASFGSELEFWSSYAAPDPQRDAQVLAARGSTSENDRAFVEAVALARQAARERPGMEHRNFDWNGRGFDAVFYLLSPAYRNGQGHWSEIYGWAGEALFGAQILHANAVTTIGSKIRYTPPNLLREYAELLQLITREELREHFEPEAMARFGVYKYFGDPYDFDDWMWPQFESWRAFLVSMLDFPDEGIICCVS